MMGWVGEGGCEKEVGWVWKSMVVERLRGSGKVD